MLFLRDALINTFQALIIFWENNLPDPRAPTGIFLMATIGYAVVLLAGAMQSGCMRWLYAEKRNQFGGWKDDYHPKRDLSELTVGGRVRRLVN